MRRTLATLAALALATLALACGTGTDNDTTTTPPTAGPPSGATDITVDVTDHAYYTTVREHTTAWDDTSDDDLILLGWAVCLTLDGGASYLALVNELVDTQDASATDAAYLAGSAVAAYCPEYIPTVTGKE